MLGNAVEHLMKERTGRKDFEILNRTSLQIFTVTAKNPLHSDATVVNLGGSHEDSELVKKLGLFSLTRTNLRWRMAKALTSNQVAPNLNRAGSRWGAPQRCLIRLYGQMSYSEPCSILLYGTENPAPLNMGDREKHYNKTVCQDILG